MTKLIESDEEVAAAARRIGFPAPRLWSPGFESLFSILLSQQVSTEASKAILGRVVLLMDELSPQEFLKTHPDALRKAGMSYRKIEYATGLAKAIVDGRLDLDGLGDRTDSEAIAAITGLRGFGTWSAEIYLMFSLGRADLFPSGDLALRSALGRLKQLPDPPTPEQACGLVEHWSPWRSVGSLFLWHYYRGAPL